MLKFGEWLGTHQLCVLHRSFMGWVHMHVHIPFLCLGTIIKKNNDGMKNRVLKSGA